LPLRRVTVRNDLGGRPTGRGEGDWMSAIDGWESACRILGASIGGLAGIGDDVRRSLRICVGGVRRSDFSEGTV
jgi:hypothetical protein